MLQLDYRAGSGDLVPYLLAAGVKAELTELGSGDAAWVGNGPEGCPILCGIEVKKLADLVASIEGGRMAAQAQAMQDAYQKAWVLVEGKYGAADDGRLAVRQYNPKTRKSAWEPFGFGARKYMYREIEGYLTSLEVMGGFGIRRTADRTETGWMIASIYKWWGKQWEDHKALSGLHKVELGTGEGESGTKVRISKPSLVREWAAKLPGVGSDKSKGFDRRFATPRDLALGEVGDYEGIEGVGRKMAVRIYNAINFGG